MVDTGLIMEIGQAPLCEIVKVFLGMWCEDVVYFSKSVYNFCLLHFKEE